MLFFILLLVFAVLTVSTTCVFLYIKWLDTYWERRGIFTYRSTNKNENITLETYKNLKARGLKHGAFVKFYRPLFMTTDLDEIKAILMKDSDHFINRGMYSNRKADRMSASLTRLENEEWKSLRNVLSSIFSSGKLKKILADIVEHGQKLQAFLDNKAETNEPFEAKDLMKRFGMDSMGSCTFGFEINTLKGENREFQDVLEKRVLVHWRTITENLVNKNILKILRFRTSDPKLTGYIQSLINDTNNYRAKNSIIRNDIFQYVQQITDKTIDDNEIVKDKKLSNAQMVRALHTFFLGGFEATSNLTSFVLLELALNQDKQDKLRESICQGLIKHAALTYDAIMEMDYLDWVINESLRKYPPGSVTRYCNKTYKLPNSNMIIHPGEFISIPTIGIHNDPDYYSNPEKFEPERFSPVNKAKRPSMAFLPFGDGPRKCIGFRLGLIVSKVAVASVINKFKVTLNEKTNTPVQFHKKSVLLYVENGIWLNCARIV